MDLSSTHVPRVGHRNLHLEHDANVDQTENYEIALPEVRGEVRVRGKQSGIGGFELLADFLHPSWMGEVTCSHHSNPFAGGPQRQMLDVQIPARCAGILRVNVQVRVEAHAVRSYSGESGRHQARSA